MCAGELSAVEPTTAAGEPPIFTVAMVPPLIFPQTDAATASVPARVRRAQ